MKATYERFDPGRVPYGKYRLARTGAEHRRQTEGYALLVSQVVVVCLVRSQTISRIEVRTIELARIARIDTPA